MNDILQASPRKRNQYDFRTNLLYWSIGSSLYGSDLTKWSHHF